MKIAMISSIAWRTPPRHYGPWESVVSLLTEGLVARGIEVTLFATSDSITTAKLQAVCHTGYEEDKEIEPKVWECLHIAEVFERAAEFDLIHNHFDFLPLTYSSFVKTPVVTTIHGFSSPKIYPVYEKYNASNYYVAISNADRYEKLDYTATVYHGLDLSQFTFNPHPQDYLLFFGRMHHDKGAREALQIARAAGMKLIMAGIIQDEEYFRQYIAPQIDGEKVEFVGSVGPDKRNKLLGNARALIHSINFQEPFGLSVIEAMACGTPVVAFNKGSMPELIDDRVDGYLVEGVNEAVAACDLLARIPRKACRHKVESKFTIEKVVDNYIQVYNKILGMNG